MKISIIVPVWNGRPYLESCFDALIAQRTGDGAAPEVIAVDNASTDDSAAFIKAQFPTVHLIRNRTNQGFAGACNRGIEAATGELCVVLNQDTQVQPGWLEALHHATADADTGAIGCKILYPDGQTIQHAGAMLQWPLGFALHIGIGQLDQGQWNTPREVEFVTGAALALRKKVLTEVGLFDEGFWPGYFEDVDLCLRIRATGYKILYAPQAVVLHQESTSVRDPALRAYYYHCGRLRLLLKHLPPDRWLREFIPAEMESLPNFVRQQDGFSLHLAYTTLIMTAPQLLIEHWRADTETTTQIVDALLNLYTQANTEMGRLHSERLAATAPAWRAQLVTAENAANQPRILPLDELNFTSQVRVIGPLIAGLRHLWYNMAARWGDRYLRLQQDSINANLADEMMLLRQQVDLLLAVNARQTAAIARLEHEKTPSDHL